MLLTFEYSWTFFNFWSTSKEQIRTNLHTIDRAKANTPVTHTHTHYILLREGRKNPLQVLLRRFYLESNENVHQPEYLSIILLSYRPPLGGTQSLVWMELNSWKSSIFDKPTAAAASLGEHNKNMYYHTKMCLPSHSSQYQHHPRPGLCSKASPSCAPPRSRYEESIFS